MTFSQRAAHSPKAGASRIAEAGRFALFALGSSAPLGQAVAQEIGVDLTPVEERMFEDGEHKLRPLADVRGRRVCILSSLHGEPDESPNDKLCRLLFFVGCLRDAGATHISVVAPYLCYARKDRQTKPYDPVTSRYVAQLFEAVGTDHLATLEVHNPSAFQNAFRCDTDHIESAAFFADALAGLVQGENLAVVSPDSGGMKRVETLREALERATGKTVAKGFMEKLRSMGRVTGDLFAGDVSGRTVIIFDDLISTGGSMARTAAECRRRGATRVICAAAHGLFVGGAPELFGSDAVERVIVTDSVAISPALKASAGHRLTVLGIAPLLARAMTDWHRA